MELYVDSSLLSRAAVFLVRYVRLEGKANFKLNTFSDQAKQLFNLTQLPALVTKRDGNFTVAGALFSYLTKISYNSAALEGDDLSKSEIQSFVTLVERMTPADIVAHLNQHLLTKSFLVGFHVTLADIVCSVFAYEGLRAMNLEDREKNINTFRWFNHIQHLPGLKEQFEETGLLMLPSEEKKLEETKQDTPAAKGGKKQKGAKSAEAAAEGKKSKQQKLQEEAAKKKTDFSKMDLRVGKITKIWKNPDSEKCYNEEIDIGGGEIRSIASGLVKHIPIEQLEGSMVLVLANLKPKNIAGYKSHGMLLCASNADKTDFEVIRPSDKAQPGDKVTAEGYDGKPKSNLDMKKDWEPLSVLFKTNEESLASFNGIALKAGGETLSVPTLKDALIS